MADVVLQGVSKTYPGRVEAVAAAELNVHDGEFVVLVGPSGCGKSTTLRLIAGLERATGGEIWIGGRRVDGVAPKDRNIAMVFQNYALYPHMSVRDNMAFGLRLRHGVGTVSGWLWWLVWPPKGARIRQRRRWIDAEVVAAARVLGIEPLLDRMPRQLSGGERQRVALGRAMVRKPAVFLFDEPLSNLDAQRRGEMRRELKRLHHELQATMIYVTHDQVEALTMGDRVVVMDRGAIQQIGTPRAVYDRPTNRFVAEFIGSPPMNFVVGRLVSRQQGVWFRGAGLSFPVGEPALRIDGMRGLVMGIRPEHVRVVGNSEVRNRDGGNDAGGQKDEVIGPSKVGKPPAGIEDPVGTGRVTQLEPLGDVTVVYVQTDLEPDDDADAENCRSEAELSTVLACKETARLLPEVGARVVLELDADRVHFFDPDSGRALGPRVEND